MQTIPEERCRSGISVSSTAIVSCRQLRLGHRCTNIARDGGTKESSENRKRKPQISPRLLKKTSLRRSFPGLTKVAQPYSHQAESFLTVKDTCVVARKR